MMDLRFENAFQSSSHRTKGKHKLLQTTATFGPPNVESPRMRVKRINGRPAVHGSFSRQGRSLFWRSSAEEEDTAYSPEWEARDPDLDRVSAIAVVAEV